MREMKLIYAQYQSRRHRSDRAQVPIGVWEGDAIFGRSLIANRG